MVLGKRFACGNLFCGFLVLFLFTAPVARGRDRSEAHPWRNALLQFCQHGDHQALHPLGCFLSPGASTTASQSSTSPGWPGDCYRWFTLRWLPQLGRSPGRCEAFVVDLFEILDPHARVGLAPPLADAYESTSCRYNHLAAAPGGDAPTWSSAEIGDRYLLRRLGEGALERALAYFLVNLHIDRHRPEASADLYRMALAAVVSAEPQEEATRQRRQALQVLALFAHQHSLEIALSSHPSELDRFAAASLTAMAGREHYLGPYWRSELVHALLRGYRLLGRWYAERSPVEETRARFYWLGAFVGCELRARGHPQELLPLAADTVSATQGLPVATQRRGAHSRHGRGDGLAAAMSPGDDEAGLVGAGTRFGAALCDL